MQRSPYKFIMKLLGVTPTSPQELFLGTPPGAFLGVFQELFPAKAGSKDEGEAGQEVEPVFPSKLRVRLVFAPSWPKCITFFSLWDVLRIKFARWKSHFSEVCMPLVRFVTGSASGCCTCF